ncbi:MAG: hypothetical protein ACHQ2Z_03475 [Elusimicrobiota bacterium]
MRLTRRGALTLLIVGGFAAAAKAARVALADADDVLHAVHWLGFVIESQGRYAEAEGVVRKGLERTKPGDSFSGALLDSLARLDAAQGRRAQAEETYRRALAPCGARSGRFRASTRHWATPPNTTRSIAGSRRCAGRGRSIPASLGWRRASGRNI